MMKKKDMPMKKGKHMMPSGEMMSDKDMPMMKMPKETISNGMKKKKGKLRQRRIGGEYTGKGSY